MRKTQITMLICCLSLASGVAGCQVGRMITSINKESKVPTFDVSVLPKQSEPEVEEEDSPASADATETERW